MGSHPKHTRFSLYLTHKLFSCLEYPPLYPCTSGKPLTTTSNQFKGHTGRRNIFDQGILFLFWCSCSHSVPLYYSTVALMIFYCNCFPPLCWYSEGRNHAWFFNMLPVSCTGHEYSWCSIITEIIALDLEDQRHFCHKEGTFWLVS